MGCEKRLTKHELSIVSPGLVSKNKSDEFIARRVFTILNNL